MPITGENRTKLNSVIGRMKANNESEDSIKEMVSQFKAKYNTPAETPGFMGRIGGALKDVGQGVKESFTAIKEYPGSAGRGFVQGVLTPFGEGPQKKEELGAFQGVPTSQIEDISKGFKAQGVPGAFGEKEFAGIREEEQKFAKQEAASEQLEGPGRFASKLGLGIAAASTAPIIGAGVLPTLAKGALANIPFAAQSFEEGGGKGALTDVALSTGFDALTFGTGKALKPVKTAIGKALQGVGKKIQMSTLKPTKAAIKNGFDINTVFNEGLEGNLEQAQKKISVKFKELSQELQSKLKDSDAKINIKEVLESAVQKMDKDKAAQFGANTKMQNAVKDYLSEIEAVAPDGLVNLIDANKIKRGIGRKGAWSYGSRDMEANAMEKVSNALYTELKEAIEKSAPEGLKELNQRISKLIPIEQAIIHRTPISARNEMISLTDVITAATALSTGPKGWGLAIANRLSKSPGAGKGLFRMGEKLGTKEVATQTIGQLGRKQIGKEIIKNATEDEEKKKRPNLDALGRKRF